MRTLALPQAHEHEPNCVRQVPIFSGLTAQQQDLVASLARPVVLSPGEFVYRADEQPGQIAVVHTGQVKLSRIMPSGRQRLLRVVEPGETLGEHTFLSGDTTVDEATAMTQTQLCIFSHDKLFALIKDYPDIAIRMLQTLNERLAQTERALALTSLSLDVRLADFLLEQPLLTSSATAWRVRLPLRKKDIASLLGTTPESLSRALARLEAKRLISIDDDVVTFHDLEGLEDLVTNA